MIIPYYLGIPDYFNFDCTKDSSSAPRSPLAIIVPLLSTIIVCGMERTFIIFAAALFQPSKSES